MSPGREAEAESLGNDQSSVLDLRGFTSWGSGAAGKTFYFWGPQFPHL